MIKYIAFLRAINVGGRNVKMYRLRQIFEEMSLVNVETFIASGNVIFDSDVVDRKNLETQIEVSLQEALGYRVDTFLRTVSELTAIAEYQPFAAAELENNNLYIGFLANTPSDEREQDLQGFANEIDSFHIHEHQVYWLCRKSISVSKFTGGKLEKALDMPATLRNVRTIKRLVSKYYEK